MDRNPATKHGLSIGNSSACSSNQQKRQSSDSMQTNGTSFKQFDIVVDYSDHHFANQAMDVQKTSKDWTKKIQQDWKFLEENLPETIFVRVYEGRMDLMRAVMIGPAGTPYHDGLFFFDFHFPASYPHVPPRAYYHSGGLRLNPNLYADGTVCLSLLNTWLGKGCEKWNPKNSTMLQVLVSIQALVLNAKPYFNEPGFGWLANTSWGKKGSLAYNETAFLFSCKTMVYALRKPPKNFEHFVVAHFREHGRAILLATKAYMNGTQIGYFGEESGKHDVKGSKGRGDFTAKLDKQFEVLSILFISQGVDCKDIIVQNVKEADCKETLTRKGRVGDSSGAQKAAAKSKKICAQQQQAKIGNASITLASGSKKKDLDASGTSKPAKSLLKGLTQYLLKLGRKILPVEK